MRYRKVSYSYKVVVQDAGSYPMLRRMHASGYTLSQTCWVPAADVYETESSIIVTVELAGVSEEDAEVTLYNNALVVEGNRTLPPMPEQGAYRSAGIRQGQFRVEIELSSPVDPDRVNAAYQSGLLQITLPRARRG
ncbi:MAG: Hsp20/alpha crystallin family protein [SAR202 cluster bacterium]|nr:Hsp20/alpha crystallin family protein [SAR202 cluster bacterium]